jgi:hypothetical protein
MSDDIDLTLLRSRAALMTATNPAFLGSVLARYQQIEGLDPEGIARYLRVSAHRLDALALCRLPRPNHFAEGIDSIATRFDVDPLALARMLREVAAIEALSGDTTGEWLQAARDVDEPDRQSESDHD